MSLTADNISSLLLNYNRRSIMKICLLRVNDKWERMTLKKIIFDGFGKIIFDRFSN